MLAYLALSLPVSVYLPSGFALDSTLFLRGGAFFHYYPLYPNRSNKETKQNRYTSKTLLDKAFPKVSYAESKHINVRGNKSPYDGDIVYWSERNSKLYDDITSKALKGKTIHVIPVY